MAVISFIGALYADEVLILPPFEKLIEHSVENIDDEFRQELLIQIALLFSIEPLVEANLIGFSTQLPICQHCIETKWGKKDIIDLAFNGRIQEVGNFLFEKYSLDVSYTLELTGKNRVLHIEGPEELIEHGIGRSVKDHYMAEERNLIHKFSPEEVVQYRLFELFFREAFNEVIRLNENINFLNTNLFTNRKIYVEALSVLNDEEVKAQTKRMNKAFSHSLPFMNGADSKTLVKLREKEGEAFQVYRDALASALNSKNLSSSEMAQAFQETVRPEINKIELAIKNSEKMFSKAIAKDIVFGSGLVSIGLFSGILPEHLGQIFAALGGSKYLSSLFDNFTNLIKTPDSIRNEKYYFLWKANEKVASSFM